MEQQQKTIPIFAEPDIDPIVLGGLKCRVRRMRASKAPQVITTFLSDFGAITAEYLSTTVPDQLIDMAMGMTDRPAASDSDEPTPAEIEQFTRASGNNVIKTIVASQAFQRLADRFKDGQVVNLKYFTEALLIGYLELDGVLIESWDELDRSKISPVNIGLLLYHSLEVNFDPGFGGPIESDGKSDPPSEVVEQLESRPQHPIQTTKKGAAVSVKKTGRSARRRKG